MSNMGATVLCPIASSRAVKWPLDSLQEKEYYMHADPPGTVSRRMRSLRYRSFLIRVGGWK